MKVNEQLTAAITNLIKVKIHDRINKHAHRNFAVTASEYAKRRNDGDTFIGFHERNCASSNFTTCPRLGAMPAFASCLSITN